MTEHTEYFVVDVRHGWTNQARHPFVTFWGPESCGYVLRRLSATIPQEGH